MIKTITATTLERTGVLELVWRVFMEFEAPEYSDEGIQEFQDFIATDSIKERMSRNELLLWGYWVDGNIAGVIAARPPGHVSLLFVDKDYHRKGIAKSLYQIVLDYYRKNNTQNEITVNSSPYAREAYHRLGFVDTDIEQTVNGLRFIPMKHIFR